MVVGAKESQCLRRLYDMSGYNSCLIK